MTIALYLEPVDTLFFRGSKPFSAGEDHLAESTLPSPLTLYGAIGSYILKKNNTDLKQFFNGVEDHVLGKYEVALSNTKMSIKGPFFVKDSNSYLHPPSNIVEINGSSKVLKPDIEAGLKWDIKDLSPISLPQDDYKPIEDMISFEGIYEYLLDRDISYWHIISEKNIFERERRYGHKLNRDTLSVQEHYLYSTEHLRFHDKLSGMEYEKTEILILIEGVDRDLFDYDTLYLGGEKRIVRISRILESEHVLKKLEEILESVKKSKRFFLYFATPAIFSEGYIRKWPEDIFKGAELLAIALNKSVFISGWIRNDSAKGHPRSLRRCVPPGSVYFFRTEGWDDSQFQNLFDQYHFKKSLSEEYDSAGFGTTLIGTW